MQVEMRAVCVPAVANTTEDLASTHMFSWFHRRAARLQVRIVYKAASANIEDDIVSVDPAERCICGCNYFSQRLVVRNSIARVSDDSVGTREDVRSVTGPHGIRRFIRSSDYCLSVVVKADEIDCEPLRTSDFSIGGKYAPPVVRMVISGSFVNQPHCVTKRQSQGYGGLKRRQNSDALNGQRRLVVVAEKDAMPQYFGNRVYRRQRQPHISDYLHSSGNDVDTACVGIGTGVDDSIGEGCAVVVHHGIRATVRENFETLDTQVASICVEI